MLLIQPNQKRKCLVQPLLKTLISVLTCFQRFKIQQFQELKIIQLLYYQLKMHVKQQKKHWRKNMGQHGRQSQVRVMLMMSQYKIIQDSLCSIMEYQLAQSLNHEIIQYIYNNMITDSEIKEFLPSSVSKGIRTEPGDQNITDLSFSFTHSIKSSIKPNQRDSLGIHELPFETHIQQRVAYKPPLTSKGSKKIQIPIIREKSTVYTEPTSDQLSSPRSRVYDCKLLLTNLKSQNQIQQRLSQQLVIDKLSKQLKETNTPNFSKSKELLQIELLLSAYNKLQISHSKIKQENKILEQEKEMWKLKFEELEKKIKSPTNIHSKTNSLQCLFSKALIKTNSYERLKSEIYNKSLLKTQFMFRKQTTQ